MAETSPHVFLGAGHAQNERRTWIVIWLCAAMMVLEIVGGLLFGSIALVADGLHMSTHAGALLLAALAYMFARRHADDPRFSFGTGKLGDLAGFTSAIILAMISLLILYEALHRLLAPVPIHFAAAIPIACLGLAVNVASAWVLSGGHHHDHGHGHSHGHDDAETREIETTTGTLRLEIFERDEPPRFRLHAGTAALPAVARVETIRPDGRIDAFEMIRQGDYLESATEIPEPHEFTAITRLTDAAYEAVFAEHHHAGGTAHRDNNMRAAIVHVMTDAAVSLLVILGLLLAKFFSLVWMDPLAGIVGAMVIASWAFSLIRDTSGILLDMTPDRDMAARMRRLIEDEGDHLTDFHLWRLGPGHLGAILAIDTAQAHGAEYYRRLLSRFRALSHVTIEVRQL
jgi:cation diffusion facilitator family transporter